MWLVSVSVQKSFKIRTLILLLCRGPETWIILCRVGPEIPAPRLRFDPPSSLLTICTTIGTNAPSRSRRFSRFLSRSSVKRPTRIPSLFGFCRLFSSCHLSTLTTKWRNGRGMILHPWFSIFSALANDCTADSAWYASTPLLGQISPPIHGN